MSNIHHKKFIGQLLLKSFKELNLKVTESLKQVGYDDIMPSQAEILACIADDSISAVEISRLLGITKQAVGSSIKQLERNGYVEKQLNRLDARSAIVHLSPKGLRVVHDAQEIKTNIEKEYAEKLGDEQFANLKDLLANIIS